MPLRTLVFLAMFLVLAAWSSHATEPTWQEQQNLPNWARTVLAEKGFSSTYALSTKINPYFLHGDFNGDGKLDLAVLITQNKSRRHGIAFLHAGFPTPLVVGAGTTLGNGGDDFSWIDAWNLYIKQPIQQGATGKKTPVLRGDALLVQKLESASGLIYWDGHVYRWYQQGD